MSWTSATLPDLANYATVVGGVSVPLGLAAVLHRHNCHQPRCPWLVRSGKTHCKKHRPKAPPR